MVVALLMALATAICSGTDAEPGLWVSRPLSAASKPGSTPARVTNAVPRAGTALPNVQAGKAPEHKYECDGPPSCHSPKPASTPWVRVRLRRRAGSSVLSRAGFVVVSTGRQVI
jgi:hypothetical protein